MAELYNYLDRTEGQERAYHPDKSALLAPSADEVPTMLSVGFASVPKFKTVHSGVPGHFFSWGDSSADIEFDILPQVAKFSDGDDLLVLSVTSAHHFRKRMYRRHWACMTWNSPCGCSPWMGMTIGLWSM